ncbi:glycosyltransferase family 4 protein [Pseudomonadota bacterium]
MKTKITIVGLERNPFNDVQFNALVEYGFDVKVIYTVKQKDTSNNTNWCEFDPIKYSYEYLTGLSLWRLFRGVYQGRQGVILFIGYSSFCFLISMILCYGLRIVYLTFTDTPEIKRRNGFFRFVIRGIARWFAFHTSSGVLTTGAPGRRALIELGCSPTRIVNFPYVPGSVGFVYSSCRSLPHEYELLKRIDGRPVIFYSGQMIYRKGLDNLLYVLKTLKNRRIPFYLLAEGNGPQKDLYFRLVQCFDIADQVEFLGFSQSQEHARYLALSDIVVSPSRWEPWGNVIPEAMQIGKAVISSDSVASAADRIIDGYNGMIFETDNVGSLCRKLEALLLDSDLRRQLSDNAKNTAESWFPDLNAVNLSTYLAEISN